MNKDEAIKWLRHCADAECEDCMFESQPIEWCSEMMRKCVSEIEKLPTMTEYAKDKKIENLELEVKKLNSIIKGAKILIYQQKNLVRCRDCKYSFYDDDTEYYECRHNKGIAEEHYGTDFCSYGERNDDSNT